MDDRLSAQQAATLLGISERRVRQLANFLAAERDASGKLWFDRGAVSELSEVRRRQARGQLALERVVVMEADLDVMAEGLRVLAEELETAKERIAKLEDLLDNALSSDS